MSLLTWWASIRSTPAPVGWTRTSRTSSVRTGWAATARCRWRRGRSVSEKVSRAAEADIHKKSWGYEEWITNSIHYCGKRLVFEKKGGKTSLHFHINKRETMWCLKGAFAI